MSAETTSFNGVSPTGWLNTPRGRRDLPFILAFLIPNILIPLLIVDLYPFSRAPMFADAPRQCCNYRLIDPERRSLSLLNFGLRRNYWGNPVGEGVGFIPPPSLDQFGLIAEREEITEHLRQRMRQDPSLAYIDVVQEVIGDVDGQTVDVIPERTRSWRVENPAYQGRKKP